jgi:hypothetical protein
LEIAGSRWRIEVRRAVFCVEEEEIVHKFPVYDHRKVFQDSDFYPVQQYRVIKRDFKRELLEM